MKHTWQSAFNICTFASIIARWNSWAHQKAFLEAPTSLKMMVLGVASNPQSIGSSAFTVAPIVPEIILGKMEYMCGMFKKYVTWLIVHQNRH